MSDGPRANRGELWTSAEVARAFRIGVSSIKRWTDEGELESVRTPGGHRRYSLPALYRFASIRNLSFHDLPQLEQGLLFEDIPPETEVTLHDALVMGDAEAVKQLVTPHVSSTVQRAAFLDRVVGNALRDLGDEAADVVHRAGYIAADALDRLRPRTRKDGPLVILACPPGEWHDLPLRLVRLVFEWSNWRTDFLGATLPWASAREAVERTKASILAFSARTPEPFQHPEFAKLVEWCRERATTVITGGEWARGGSGGEKEYLRFRTLRGFEKWLRGRAESM